jgi:hypothetical protein
MNKYVFPGADASLPLGWVIKQGRNCLDDESNGVSASPADRASSSRPTLRSSRSTFSACTTRPPSTGGTSTGSPTRRRSSPSTASGGTASGSTSSRTLSCEWNGSGRTAPTRKVGTPADAPSASRQGSASVFQITAHKNLNGFHRVSWGAALPPVSVRLD